MQLQPPFLLAVSGTPAFMGGGFAARLCGLGCDFQYAVGSLVRIRAWASFSHFRSGPAMAWIGGWCAWVVLGVKFAVLGKFRRFRSPRVGRGHWTRGWMEPRKLDKITQRGHDLALWDHVSAASRVTANPSSQRQSSGMGFWRGRAVAGMAGDKLLWLGGACPVLGWWELRGKSSNDFTCRRIVWQGKSGQSILPICHPLAWQNSAGWPSTNQRAKNPSCLVNRDSHTYLTAWKV